MSVKCILTEQGSGGGGGGGANIAVSGIEVTTPPTKTSYYSGDPFDPTEMVVTASYTLEGMPFSTANVTASCAFSPQIVTDDTTQVEVSYVDSGGNTHTDYQDVTVTKRLTRIDVTTNPTTMTYEYDDAFDTTGMVVTATYTDGSTEEITPQSVSPANGATLNTIGTNTVTVSFQDESVTSAVTTTFGIMVERKRIARPTWKGTLTYNGSSQSANVTTLWNDYDTSCMTIAGTTSGTNATSYSATFTPGGNYQWADGSDTTSAHTVSWSIDKAENNITLSASTVDITATNYNTGVSVTVTRNGEGAISAVSSDSSAVPVTYEGNTVTITGDGETAGDFIVTVNVAEGTNYLAGTATIVVNVVYWKWDSVSNSEAVSIPEGDETWWAGLKNWLATSSAADRANALGKKVQVTLSSAVLGTTTHYVRCVGHDCDGANTLTFQTMNCLAETTTFGSNSIWYNGSTNSRARAKCIDYYNAFPGKLSIRTVNKRYLSTQPGSVHKTSCDKTYQETVFLPSENEMGWTATGSASGSVGCGGANNEYCVDNTGKVSYQYYTGNNRRVKYKGTDSDPEGQTSGGQWYWDRSRYYHSNYSTYVCVVNNAGNAGYSGYTSSGGLAPAFAI